MALPPSARTSARPDAGGLRLRTARIGDAPTVTSSFRSGSRRSACEQSERLRLGDDAAEGPDDKASRKACGTVHSAYELIPRHGSAHVRRDLPGVWREVPGEHATGIDDQP